MAIFGVIDCEGDVFLFLEGTGSQGVVHIFGCMGGVQTMANKTNPFYGSDFHKYSA